MKFYNWFFRFFKNIILFPVFLIKKIKIDVSILRNKKKNILFEEIEILNDAYCSLKKREPKKITEQCREEYKKLVLALVKFNVERKIDV